MCTVCNAFSSFPSSRHSTTPLTALIPSVSMTQNGLCNPSSRGKSFVSTATIFPECARSLKDSYAGTFFEGMISFVPEFRPDCDDSLHTPPRVLYVSACYLCMCPDGWADLRMLRQELRQELCWLFLPTPMGQVQDSFATEAAVACTNCRVCFVCESWSISGY